MNFSKFGTWSICVISILIIIFPDETLQQHGNDKMHEFTEIYTKFYQDFELFKHVVHVIQENEDPDEAMLQILRNNLHEIRPFLKALEPVFAVTSKYYDVAHWAKLCQALLDKMKVFF